MARDFVHAESGRVQNSDPFFLKPDFLYTPCTKIRLQKNKAGILYTAIFRVYKIRVLLFYAPNFVHGHFGRVQKSDL